MKKMRKAISLIVALCFLLSIAAPAMAADVSEAQKAGNRLLALGIIEGYTDGTLGLDKQITRAEIAVVLAKASGMASAAEMLKNTPSKFTDVKTGEWYTGWINLAASQGWVKGDPQGTFRPNDPVSYREIVTVLMKILGYNDNLPGEWPANYLAKAASLGITKGISFDAKAPATRGDVFIMTSRVLDKEVVNWDSDRNDFVYKNGKTLLEDKLEFAKVEGVVTDIPRVTSSLKDNQIKIDGKTYKVVGNVDFEEIFGTEVEAWLNDDDEVVFVSIESDDVLYDALEDVYEDELTLKDADEDYDIAKDAIIYVNGEKLSASERRALKGEKYDYAKVVLNEDGDVAFVDAYKWDDFLVVEKVDGDEILGYGDELDAEDFTIVKDGKTISLKDLKEGDILFYNKSAEYAEVYNKSVEGEIERIYTDRIKVAGKEYKNTIAKYINEDGDIANLNNSDFKDIVETMKDAGKVTVFINRNGDMVFLSGDLSDLVTVSRYVMITKVGNPYFGRNGKVYPLDVINAEGKVLKYDIEEDDLEDILGTTTWPFVTTDKGKVLEIAYDKDGDIDEITILDPATTTALSDFEVKEKYVNGYKIDRDAVVFLAEDYVISDDTDDIEISKYADLDFDLITSGWAYIKDDKVVAFVVTGSDREDDSTTYYTVATADAIKDAKDNIYTLKLVIDGKKVTVDTKKNISVYPSQGVKKGDLLVVKIDDKTGYVNEVTKATNTASGTVSDIKTADKSFKVNNTEYKLGADAVVVDATDSYKVISLSNLKNGDTVKVAKISSTSKYVEVVVRTAKASSVPEPERTAAGVLRFDFENFNRSSDMTIHLKVNGENKVYNVLKSAVVIAPNGEVASGTISIGAGSLVNFILVEGTSDIAELEVVELNSNVREFAVTVNDIAQGDDIEVVITNAKYQADLSSLNSGVLDGNKTVKVEVLDSSNNTVYTLSRSQTFTAGEVTIKLDQLDTSELATGTYTVKVTIDDVTVQDDFDIN